MLLTITTTCRPATDLGYLLAKNPDRSHTFSLPFGNVHVCYPEASDERCTAALFLDIDPIELVRGNRNRSHRASPLAHYINDRPYVASSFLSVAIARVLGSALGGRSRERQELADTNIPLEAFLPALPCRSGESFLQRLFEPLGYEVRAVRLPLDEKFPEWGDGSCFSVTLKADCRLKELLSHLYVLVPVLDDEKHYWVGEDELSKLLAKGEGWLSTHPERERIVQRYLKYQRRLVREALERLAEEDMPDPDATEERNSLEEHAIEEKISLNERRIDSILSALKEIGARRVIDLGCGEGRLLQKLLREREFERIAGTDVSWRALEIAGERLHLDQLPPMQRQRIDLFQGALTYRDRRFEGFDAACVIEVIEHLDPARLITFERVVFEFARPKTVIVTTPNVEYNVRFENLRKGQFRHRDHRFEWTRAEFAGWATEVARRHGYQVRIRWVGSEDPGLGAPTQMGIFSL